VKKIFILLGHENKETLSGALASAYQTGANESGHEVRRMNIGDMKFDPLLHKGYKEIQELEPDLKLFQENITWADHIVIVHPIWWATIPAILKGLFERAWLPGFAYRYVKNNMTWKRLLKGKTGRLIILQNSPPFIADILFGNYSSILKSAVLRFAGIWPVRVTRFYRSEHTSPERGEKLKKKIVTLGRQAR